jgi:hypothetical protein
LKNLSFNYQQNYQQNVKINKYLIICQNFKQLWIFCLLFFPIDELLSNLGN